MDDVIDCEIEQAPRRDGQGVRVGYSFTTVRYNGDWVYTNTHDRLGVPQLSAALHALGAPTTARHPADWP